MNRNVRNIKKHPKLTILEVKSEDFDSNIILWRRMNKALFNANLIVMKTRQYVDRYLTLYDQLANRDAIYDECILDIAYKNGPKKRSRERQKYTKGQRERVRERER